jgi:sugar phosphate isomerase/epimerase
MISQVNRRHFLSRTMLATAAVLGVPSLLATADSHPARLSRNGLPRFLPGLAAYSFRKYMKHSSHARDRIVAESDQIDLFQFIDYAADQGCVGAELTSYYFPPDVSRKYLVDIRRHAFLRGVEISGTAVGNTFALPDGRKLDEQIAHVNRWVDHCVVMGAPHVRVFSGVVEGISTEEAKNQCIKSLRRCGDYAGERGVMLGIENHGGLVSSADLLEEIVNEVNHEWVRVNLDTGNFYSDHPYEDMERLAPYAVNVQFKVEINRVPGGKEPSDFERMVKILRAANYQGYVSLEYESAEDPYTAVPKHLDRLKVLLR